MNEEMGELLVGAYLKVIEQCDIVCYNQHIPGGGLEGLGEFDVLGLHFEKQTAFLCEVATHIGGLLYVNNKTTVKRIADKHRRQKAYAAAHLKGFLKKRYQLWSPVVRNGYLTTKLPQIDPDLELVINEEYTKRVEDLRIQSREHKNDENNPAFRLLQILEHLR